MIWDSCLEAGEHDGFKLFHNRTNFHTGNQKYFNLKAKLFYLLQRLKMGNFLLKHPSPAEINGNKVKSVFSYRLQHQKLLQGLLVNLSQDRDIFAWNSLFTKYKGNHSALR